MAPIVRAILTTLKNFSILLKNNFFCIISIIKTVNTTCISKNNFHSVEYYAELQFFTIMSSWHILFKFDRLT